jgi:hypothetical protein
MTLDFIREQAARPEVAALQDRAQSDRELLARHYADAPGQEARLRRAGWKQAVPGRAGLGGWGDPRTMLRMIHSMLREDDGSLWAHASFSLHGGDRVPEWYLLRDAHWLLYPDVPAVQVVAPRSQHVNIAEVAHLWTRLDAPAVPDFGRFGTI